MSQHRKDQDVQNRQSDMDQAKGSGSVMDDKESFEHGSGTSDVARGMGSSGERGSASGRSGEGKSERQRGSGISNRGPDEAGRSRRNDE